MAALVQQNFSFRWSDQHAIINQFLDLIIFLAAAATDLLDGYLAPFAGRDSTVNSIRKDTFSIFTVARGRCPAH